jgi:hypothetical protein
MVNGPFQETNLYLFFAKTHPKSIQISPPLGHRQIGGGTATPARPGTFRPWPSQHA